MGNPLADCRRHLVALATFADAAAGADLVVNATGGGVTLEVLTAAGAENLAGKVLVDIANPLDFSAGLPAHPLGQGHRLARRAGAAGVPGGAGREDAQHA